MLPLYDVKFQYIFRLILTVCVLFYRAFSLFLYIYSVQFSSVAQSCPTLCDPIDGSPPGSSVPGILQARTLEWGAIAFSALPYYCCSNQKQVCSASLDSDIDGWSQPLGTNNTKESGIHTSAKPVCVAKTSIFHDQTSEEQCLL